MNQPKNKPVAKIKQGRIAADIWQNDSEQGTRFTVTLSRSYRNKEDGTWKTTTSFGRDDLLLLAKVADQAHSKIVELMASLKASQ